MQTRAPSQVQGNARQIREALFQHLPAPVVSYLTAGRRRVLDLGGDEGADVFRELLPDSEVLTSAEAGGDFDVVVSIPDQMGPVGQEPYSSEWMWKGAEKAEQFYLALFPAHDANGCSPPGRLGKLRLWQSRPVSDGWLLGIYASADVQAQLPAHVISEEELQKWNSYYDQLELAPETPAMRAFHDQLVPLIHDLVGKEAPVMEAGCGSGWQSLALVRAGTSQLTVLDVSLPALRSAEAVFEKHGHHANFQLGDIFAPAEPAYDLVFNAGVLEHYTLDQQAAFLEGMASRSRKYVMALVPNRLCYWYWLWRMRAGKAGQWAWGKECPVQDLSAAFEKAGLRYLGTTFLGEAWTEDLIQMMTGMDGELREDVLRAHRSLVLEPAQKGYLVAALGTVLKEEVHVPTVWRSNPLAHEQSLAELTASLADNLALQLASDSERRKEAARHQQQLAEVHQQLTQSRAEHAYANKQLEAVIHAVHTLVPTHRPEAGGCRPEEANAESVSCLPPACSLQPPACTEEVFQEALHCVEQARRDHYKVKSQLDNILSSRTYRIAQRLTAMKRKLAPAGSRREGLLRGCKKSLNWLRRQRPIDATTGAMRGVLKRLGFLKPPLEERQLPDVLARVKASRGAIIFLPSVPWTLELFQRPQHLARELARLGYTVIYDCSGTRENAHGFAELEPGLYVYKGRPDVLHKIPDPWLWTFSYNYDQKDAYPKGTRCIYDWIDDLTVFPYDQEVLQYKHKRAMQEADVVASVARKLDEEARKDRPDAMYLPNAVEYGRFTGTASVPDDRQVKKLLDQGKPIAGYYGALASWFDYQLLYDVAQSRPDWSFLLIGPDYDGSLPKQPLLKDCPNVVWVGPKPYEQLPGYLQLFDCATIPFAINDITLATSPLKLYEYLAGGKPVITTPMPECMAHPEVRIIKTAQEFSAALDAARAEGQSESRRQELRAVGAANSWAARARTITRRMDAVDQVRDLSTPDNLGLFRALTAFFDQSVEDPCYRMWFEFAASTNQRGDEVARLLKKHVDLKGKKYLDVGCAYGGFLVAFARHGAEVAGLDLDSTLLELARVNLRHTGVDGKLLLQDATRPDVAEQHRAGYDVITCNDVIEHVLDPAGTIKHLAGMLRPGGAAYFEIPNRYYTPFVIEDGHFRLFGITLLDHDEAKEFYAQHTPGTLYTVGHYYTIEEYNQLFEDAGLEMTLLPETFTYNSLGVTLDALARLEQEAPARIETVPAGSRDRVAQALQTYLNEIKSAPRNTNAEVESFQVRYGVSFWKILARKKDAVAQKQGQSIAA